jgi:hypothetical protein
MQIKTVSSSNSDSFEREVNKLLAEGWELHGNPNIQTVAQQDTWDGRLRAWSTTMFSQVLKKV